MRRIAAFSAAVALTLALVLPGTTAAGGAGVNAGNRISIATVDFAPGYWTPGVHTYWVNYNQDWCGCGDTIYGPFSFTVDPVAPLYPGHVMLTNQDIWGSLWSYTGPVDHNTINPAQATFFYAGWTWDFTGASYTPPDTMQTAKMQLAGSFIAYKWDGGSWVVGNQSPVTSVNVAGFGVPQVPATGWFMRTHGKRF